MIRSEETLIRLPKADPSRRRESLSLRIAPQLPPKSTVVILLSLPAFVDPFGDRTLGALSAEELRPSACSFCCRLAIEAMDTYHHR